MKASRWAPVLLRLALGTTFLSAVASRLAVWGPHSGHLREAFSGFCSYVGELNPWLPHPLRPALAVVVTAMEISLGLALLAGFRTRVASLGAAALLTVFALAMTVFTGVKSAFDYSVWSAATGALLLWTVSGDAPTEGRSQGSNVRAQGLKTDRR